MGKLTLSVNDEVVARAKHYAKARKLSLSEIVETYLSSLTDSKNPGPLPPALVALRGSLRKGDVEDYRKQLDRRYR